MLGSHNETLRKKKAQPICGRCWARQRRIRHAVFRGYWGKRGAETRTEQCPRSLKEIRVKGVREGNRWRYDYGSRTGGHTCGEARTETTR